MQTFHVEGRSVLVVQIDESEHKPVFAKDENGKSLAYIRIKDENILATPVHLRVWQQRRQSGRRIDPLYRTGTTVAGLTGRKYFAFS